MPWYVRFISDYKHTHNHTLYKYTRTAHIHSLAIEVEGGVDRVAEGA